MIIRNRWDLILARHAYSDEFYEHRFWIIQSWEVASAEHTPSDKVHNHTFKKPVVMSMSRMRAARLKNRVWFGGEMKLVFISGQIKVACGQGSVIWQTWSCLVITHLKTASCQLTDMFSLTELRQKCLSLGRRFYLRSAVDTSHPDSRL